MALGIVGSRRRDVVAVMTVPVASIEQASYAKAAETSQIQMIGMMISLVLFFLLMPELKPDLVAAGLKSFLANSGRLLTSYRNFW